MVAASLEGVLPATSFERYNEVSVTQIVNADISTIKERLKQPIHLSENRNLFLKLFPLPQNIQAETLNQGDVHQLDFVYHRWFATNTHEGSMKVKLAHVSDFSIETEIDDTSYISNYMQLHGTKLQFKPLSAGQTEVTLQIQFDRKLDPFWYFEPLQRFAIEQSAAYLIDEMIAKPAPSV